MFGRRSLIIGLAAGAALAAAVQGAGAAAILPYDAPGMASFAHLSLTPQPLMIALLAFALGAALLFRRGYALVIAGAVLGVLALGIDIAFAADAAAPETVAQATSETTKVTWAIGATAAQWASAIGALVLAGVTWLLRLLPAQIYAILVSIRADQMLGKSIDYGVNMVIGATKDKTLEVDVGNQVLAKALQYVIDHAPEWLQQWMGGPQKIAEMIIARLNLAPDAVPPVDQIVSSVVAASSK